MEEFSDLEEWEFLPQSSDRDAFQGFGDATKPYYFSLNSNELRESPFGGEIEQESSIFPLGPVSDLSVVGRPIEEGFDGDSGKGEVLGAEDAGMVVDFGGIGRDVGVEALKKGVESVGYDEFNVGIEVSSENLDESLIDSEKGEIVRAEDGIGENGVESSPFVGISVSSGEGIELSSNDSNVPLLVDQSIEQITVGDSEQGEAFRSEDAGKELESSASGDGAENKRMIWWRMPIELFKFCIFRVRPVWSVSMAAAIVGIFVIRRRLHMMKHKSRSIPLRITIDDKKPSQVTIHAAARLNEAFSAVHRVPVMRSSIQPGGPAPWPIVSMR